MWSHTLADAIQQMPSIRMKNVIHSAEDGSILVIPRERGLTRYARARCPPSLPVAQRRFAAGSMSRWVALHQVNESLGPR